MVYLPVKFRCGSIYFPQRYSPCNPDVRLISHYGVRIFSGSFLRYCCAAALHYVLLLGQPLPEFPCTAWHISSQPAPSVPLVLGQRILLISPASRTYFGHLRSIVKIEKSSLVVSVSPEPSAYGPFLPDILAMSIFLCRSSHFPGCIEFSTLSTSLLSDSVLQHHDSYIPTLECY